MTEHVQIFLASVDELECGEDVLGDDGEELEHGAVLSPNDDAIINESQRRRDIIATNAMGPEGQFIMDVPQSEGRVLRNSS